MFDYPSSIAISDFNADGKLDLAVSLLHWPAIVVYTGDGSGGFTATSQASVNSGARTLRVADITGDGTPDIVTSSGDILAKPYATRTALTAGSNSMGAGARLTLTARVTAADNTPIPFASVYFCRMGTGTCDGVVGTDTNGVATFDARPPVGNQTWYAQLHPASPLVGASTSATVSVTVLGATTTTVLTVTPTSAARGEVMNFVVVVASGAVDLTGSPIGSVKILDGATQVAGPFPVANGLAQGVAALFGLPGSRSITAVFAPATGMTRGSTSAPVSVMLRAATSGITLSVPAASVASGTSVPLSAQVAAPGPVVPAGTVTFYDKGVPIPGGSLVLHGSETAGTYATFRYVPSEGGHLYTAVFISSDGSVLNSASASFAVTVQPACAVALSTNAAIVGEEGGDNYTFNVSTAPGCAWTVKFVAGWVAPFPLSGTGPGTISYSVYPNFSDRLRTTDLNINNRVFQIVNAAGTGVSDERFVKLLYFNFLGRRPSADEVQFHILHGSSKGRPFSDRIIFQFS